MDPNGSFFITESFGDENGILEEEFPSQSDDVTYGDGSPRDIQKEQLDSLDEFEDLERNLVSDCDKSTDRRVERDDRVNHLFSENRLDCRSGVRPDINENNSNASGDFSSGSQKDHSIEGSLRDSTHSQIEEEINETLTTQGPFAERVSSLPDDPPSGFIMLRYIEETPRADEQSHAEDLSIESSQSLEEDGVFINEDGKDSGGFEVDELVDKIIGEDSEYESEDSNREVVTSNHRESYKDYGGDGFDMDGGHHGNGGLHSGGGFLTNEGYQNYIEYNHESEGVHTNVEEDEHSVNAAKNEFAQSSRQSFSDDQSSGDESADLGETVVPASGSNFTTSNKQDVERNFKLPSVSSGNTNSHSLLKMNSPIASQKTSSQRPDFQQHPSNIPKSKHLSPPYMADFSRNSSPITPGKIPKLNLRRMSTGSQSDMSLLSHQTSEELTNRLIDERNNRQQADEIVQRLQIDYDELLAKYAQAENTIDQLRLGAKVNLYSDGPRGSVSSTGRLEQAKQAQQLQLGGPQRAVITRTGPDGSGKHDVNIPPPQDGKQTETEMKEQVSRLKEQIDIFMREMDDGAIQPDDQKIFLDQLRQGLSQLEGDYMQAKEEHSEVQRMNKAVGHGEEATFDPDRSLDGQIFQIGMKMEEVQEKVKENLRNQPVQLKPKVLSALATEPFREEAHKVPSTPEKVLLEKFKTLQHLPATPRRDQEIENLLKELQDLEAKAVSTSQQQDIPVSPHNVRSDQEGREEERTENSRIPNMSNSAGRNKASGLRKPTKFIRPPTHTGPADSGTQSSSPEKSPDVEFDSGFVGSESSKHSTLTRGSPEMRRIRSQNNSGSRGSSIPRATRSRNSTGSGGVSSEETVIQTKQVPSPDRSPSKVRNLGRTAPSNGNPSGGEVNKQHAASRGKQYASHQNNDITRIQQSKGSPRVEESKSNLAPNTRTRKLTELSPKESSRKSRTTQPDITVSSEMNQSPIVRTFPRSKQQALSRLKRYQHENPPNSDVMSSASKSVKSEQLTALQDEIDKLHQELRARDAEAVRQELLNPALDQRSDITRRSHKGGSLPGSSSKLSDPMHVNQEQRIDSIRHLKPRLVKPSRREKNVKRSVTSQKSSQNSSNVQGVNEDFPDYPGVQELSPHGFGSECLGSLDKWSPDSQDVYSIRSSCSSKSEKLEKLREEVDLLRLELEEKKSMEGRSEGLTLGDIDSRSYNLQPPSTSSKPLKIKRDIHHRHPKLGHFEPFYTQDTEHREQLRETLRQHLVPKSASVEERINVSLPGYRIYDRHSFENQRKNRSVDGHMRGSAARNRRDLPNKEQVSFHPSVSHIDASSDRHTSSFLDKSQPCSLCNGTGVLQTRDSHPHQTPHADSPETGSTSVSYNQPSPVVSRPPLHFSDFEGLNKDQLHRCASCNGTGVNLSSSNQSQPAGTVNPKLVTSLDYPSHYTQQPTHVPHHVPMQYVLSSSVPQVTRVAFHQNPTVVNTPSHIPQTSFAQAAPYTNPVLQTQHLPASNSYGNVFTTPPSATNIIGPHVLPATAPPMPAQHVTSVQTPSRSNAAEGARPVYLVPSAKGRYYIKERMSERSSDVEEIIFRRTPRYHSTPKRKSRRTYDRDHLYLSDLDNSLDTAVRIARKLNQSANHMLGSIHQDLNTFEISC